MWSVAIVGVDCVWQGWRGRVRLGSCGVGPAFEQGADETLGLAVGLRPVGPCPFGHDLALVAGVVPAAFEAGAVVGEDALDGDAVLLVEALAGGQEADRRGVGLVRVELGVGQSGGVVDGDEQVLPAGVALGALARSPVTR